MINRPGNQSPKRDMRSTEQNPVKSDPELKGLLKRLDKIKKYKTFNRWKSKFLGRLTTLVYEKGMCPAERACDEFGKTLHGTIKCATKVTGFIEKGELSAAKKTVKASLSLSELTHNHLTVTVEKLEKLIPATGKDEKIIGFTKYHLGAVLIRQGFHQYTTMRQIDSALQAIAEKIADVADRQQLELFEQYKGRLQRFCDIMADLNLYEIMMKCMEFAEAPDPEESSDEELMMIDVEMDTPQGKQITKVEVAPSETVGDIKKAIAEDIGIEPDRQVIKFKGKEWPDNSTLGKAGVTDGSTLAVAPLKFPISVITYDGIVIKLMVDPTIYLSDLKLMIQLDSGVPAPNQEVCLDNKKLADDNKTAADYGIKAGGVIYMEPKSMTLRVDMPDGTQQEVHVFPNDTSDQVKGKIEEQTGMLPATQVLKHKGKNMPVDTMLKELGIRDRDTIQVQVLQMLIKVKDKNGKVHELLVSPRETVKDIKKQLEDKTGVPMDQQILEDGSGKELKNDDASAAGAGIEEGTMLSLDAKKMKISIELPDGTKHAVEIDAMDQSMDIKAKLSKAGLAALTMSGASSLKVNTSTIFGKK